MREILTKVYSFDELSPAAQLYALDKFRENCSYDWQDEAIGTVETIAKLCDWRVDWRVNDAGAKVEFSPKNDYYTDMTGRRAIAYVTNNFVVPAQSKAMFYKTHWINEKLTIKERYSKIFVSEDCPFTGYCMDNAFFEAYNVWLSMMRNNSKNTTVEDFLDIVADYLSRDWTADIEYQHSDEYAKEIFEANGYEFYADGRIF